MYFPPPLTGGLHPLGRGPGARTAAGAGSGGPRPCSPIGTRHVAPVGDVHGPVGCQLVGPDVRQLLRIFGQVVCIFEGQGYSMCRIAWCCPCAECKWEVKRIAALHWAVSGLNATRSDGLLKRERAQGHKGQGTMLCRHSKVMHGMAGNGCCNALPLRLVANSKSHPDRASRGLPTVHLQQLNWAAREAHS